MTVNVNPIELKVLRVLAASNWYDGFGFLNFRGIAARTKLKRKEIRRAARSLARKGLAEFQKGLWTEDGEVAGSGYGCTKAGADFLRTRAAPSKRAA
jgi:hypothetical protein